MSEIPPPTPAPVEAPGGLVRKAGTSFLWAQLSKVFEVALSTAIGLIAIRALGPDGFGSFAFLTNLFLVLTAFIPFATADALGVILPRFAERGERLFVLALLGVLRLVVVVSVYAVLAVSWLSVRDAFGMGAVTLELFLLAGLYWLAMDLLNTIAGFFLADLNSRPVAVWRSAGLAVALAAMVVTAQLGRTTVGTVFASVAVGHAIGFLGLLLVLRRRGERPRRIERGRRRGIASVSMSMWLAVLLASALSTQLDTILIGAITSNPREVAFFAAALAVLGRAQLLLYAGWSASVLPALGEALASRGREGFVRAWDLASKLWILLSLPLNTFAFVLGPPLVELAFGEIYAPAGGLLAWMAAFGIVFTFTGGMLGATALWVLGLQRHVIRVRLVTAAVHVVLAVALIAELQALGAVIASWTTLIATAAAEFVLARRAVPIRLPVEFMGRVAAAAFAGMLPGLLLRPEDPLTLAAASVGGIVAFAAGLLVARPFTDVDTDALARFSPVLPRALRLFTR